jgi:hypothetical protein
VAKAASSPFYSANGERVVLNPLTGRNANRLGTIGSTFCPSRLCYDFTQFGLRFSRSIRIAKDFACRAGTSLFNDVAR